jgi:dihydrodipicolinate synthase/N-acetylneuraminate lyase
MIETRALRGVIPVVQTPLNANGEIDTEAQARLIKFLSARRVGGF